MVSNIGNFVQSDEQATDYSVICGHRFFLCFFGFGQDDKKYMT